MKDINHLILPAIMAIGMPVIGYIMMGLVPLVVFSFAFGGGFLLYCGTIWRRPIDARRILVPYLLTVILFIIHVYEEYITDFEVLIGTISGVAVPEENFMAVAAFLAPVIWISGAICILRQWRFGDFFLCVFFFAMILAELAHFVFPFMVDGTFHYESGMYAAALPLFPALYGMYHMMRLRRRRAEA